MSHTMTMQHNHHRNHRNHRHNTAEPNIRSQDNVRYRRIGGETPYRDDPTAPVQIERYEEDTHKKLARRYVSGLPECFSSRRMLQEEGLNGKYYRDDFNDLSYGCSIGTSDEDGIWVNRGDPAGTIMAMMVWVLLGYSMLTITMLAQTGGIPLYLSYSYTLLCSLALACHAKTSFTDPGSVPPSAVPTEAQRRAEKLSMCSQCQTFKPPLSHHCRICNRCISKMDHHCPWMNNCVGAGNMKHFFLFLIYTWGCSIFSLTLLGFNYFFCASEDCVFNVVLIQLVRIMTVLSIGAFLFTSSMIMNVVYGLMTGIGTIDRLKKKATNTMSESFEEPVPLTAVFGIGPLWTWPFPIDPIFHDYDEIMGYSTPQRLLREQILKENTQPSSQVPQHVL